LGLVFNSKYLTTLLAIELKLLMSKNEKNLFSNKLLYLNIEKSGKMKNVFWDNKTRF
jgi:hypothetical protein